MLFNRRRDKTSMVLQRASRISDPRDREALIAHARELNEIAMGGKVHALAATPASIPSAPVSPELEAVARRMCLAFHLDWRGDAPTRWTALVEEQWPDFLVEARAAIEALIAVASEPGVRDYLWRALGANAQSRDPAQKAIRGG